MKHFGIVALVFLYACCSFTVFAKDEPKSISYKAFLPFIPPQVGTMVPEGEPDGKTTKMGQMSMTEVSQTYVDPTNAEKKGSVRISYNSMLAGAGGFGMMIPDLEEESTAGYKKNVMVGDYKALVEYEIKDQYARVSMSVGPIMVEADATKIESEKPLMEIIEALDLKALEKTAE